MIEYSRKIAQELEIGPKQVENTLRLLEGGATVPFISRYRKEATGSFDEVVIAKIRDRANQLLEIDKRRETILNSIREQDKLTPELEKSIMEATTLSELEDLYLPYKQKRKTRASIARARGLEPLAAFLMLQTNQEPEEQAEKYINEENGVLTLEDALAGARDIIAEDINENANVRQRLRNLFAREAVISSKVIKGKEIAGNKYETYYEFSELVQKCPSHRLLAMFRGETEEFLRISVEPDSEKAIEILEKFLLKNIGSSAKQVQLALRDSYKRLLQPSLETEMRQLAKQKADEEAIRVFTENLRQLLMSPPLGYKSVLALDPGFRSGCKLVCLDRYGKLLHNETIYPHPPQSEFKQASAKILQLVSAYKIEAIAIGNGTAGRETENFIRHIRFDKDIIAVMVNESGASVYSASSVAREEFPDYDVTVRGAVSIGRRLMDPLAELVKIDPKSIGVGQYQHDVDQGDLQKSLVDVVESCVNQVGVEANSASKELLTHVSGLGPSLAKNFIEYRNKNGAFKTRAEFKKVPRFGDKAFEQAAGFLRIRESENPLDRSAVHPESYHIVKKMAAKVDASITDLVEKPELRAKIKLEEFITGDVGLPTLNDIMQELTKPGRDPRKKFDIFEFDKSVNSMEDLKPGMVLPGIVTNITAFGAFVDVGVHQDGLVHVSQMANKFIKDPNEAVKLNQKVMVKVMDIDFKRRRIALSMKETEQ
jgi:protein Tex